MIKTEAFCDSCKERIFLEQQNWRLTSGAYEIYDLCARCVREKLGITFRRDSFEKEENA